MQFTHVLKDYFELTNAAWTHSDPPIGALPTFDPLNHYAATDHHSWSSVFLCNSLRPPHRGAAIVETFDVSWTTGSNQWVPWARWDVFRYLVNQTPIMLQNVSMDFTIVGDLKPVKQPSVCAYVLGVTKLFLNIYIINRIHLELSL